jgi:hypothetical protein
MQFTVLIQIRNAPDALHRRLNYLPRPAGKSLSEYQLREIRFAAEQPRHDESLSPAGVCELRNNPVASVHLALAEPLATLPLTPDRRLATAAGHRATIALA